LYNYLYAKQKGGDFIIRIEDTDSHRFVPGAEQYIIEALNWCGIIPDEGVENGKVVETASERYPHAPYRQSQRRSIYRQYAEQLVAGGFAYYAFDSAEELDAVRTAAEAAGNTFIYNCESRKTLRNSLTLSSDEVTKLLEERSDWTIRFKMPESRVVAMDDLIRGHIEVDTATLDDKVLWKRADELPTYHLANIVDDHLMEITEVIRGEEWLPSLPLHYLLYEAFGWERPQFAHLPLLLKPVGNGKLSKRDGDKMGFPVFPLNWVNSDGETYHGYREDGYFPEAFVNLLAMLGWNPGTEQELFSMDELIAAFSLDKVSKSGAKFNPEKAKWFNKEYLRMKADAELAAEYEKVLAQKGVPSPGAEKLSKIVSVIKDRANFVADFWTAAPYLLVAPSEYEKYGIPAGASFAPAGPVDPRAKVYDNSATAPFLAKDVEKFWKEDVIELVGKVVEALESDPATDIEEYIRANEWPLGKVMNCIRLALTGSASGLGIHEILSCIGVPEMIARIKYMKERLG